MHNTQPATISTPPTYFRHRFFFEDKLFVAYDYDNNAIKGPMTQITGEFVTFCICHKGTATIQINNHKRELTVGAQLAIIPHTHTTVLHVSKDFNCSIISISPEYRHETRYTNSIPLIDALMFFKEQTILHLSDVQQDFFIKMRDLLVLAIQTIDDSYKNPLLAELSRSFLLWQQTAIASVLNSSFVANSNNDIMAARFISLVNDNYRSQHRLEFYANQMCITPKYLSAIIKTVTGHTAGQWICIFLIGEAQNLLTNSTLSVAEIADKLGFTNQSFFGKFFKHHTGKSPLAYRLNKP